MCPLLKKQFNKNYFLCLLFLTGTIRSDLLFLTGTTISLISLIYAVLFLKKILIYAIINEEKILICEGRERLETENLCSDA